MSRQVALTKRVSLAGLSEDWDDCYAIVRPASYREALEFGESDVKSLTQIERIEVEVAFVMEHFIAGRIKVFTSDDATSAELVDMVAEDVQTSMPMANRLFREILGIAPDPKDTEKEA